MKLLRLLPTLNPAYGGPVEGVCQITPALEKLGHSTEIACLDSPSAPYVHRLPQPIYPLGPGWGLYSFSRKWIPWLKRNVNRYDVVIVHGVWQFTSFGGWLALRNASIPYFLYTHGMLDPWHNRAFPQKLLKKIPYWLLAERFVLRDARAVLFTCETEKILARQSFFPYQCHERVVNYGTAAPSGDPEAQRRLFLEKFPQLQDRRLVLFLGRLHWKKGCDLLVQAFARVADRDPKLHLVLAGPDQVGWQGKLQDMADQLGIGERLTFTGLLVDDWKWGAFHAAEVFVLPSHQENFGIAVVEAMACGIPVLISDQVNIWREIAADGAGLVAPDTLEGTVSLLNQWLDMSADECRLMGQRARKSFWNRFEIRKAAQSLIDTIQSCL
ncbi:MAG: glycosyltransferase [Thermostichales cyanobacterium BF3_bins_165]